MAKESSPHHEAAAASNDPLVRTLLEALRGVSQEVRATTELSEAALKAIEIYKGISADLAVGSRVKDKLRSAASTSPFGQR